MFCQEMKNQWNRKGFCCIDFDPLTIFWNDISLRIKYKMAISWTVSFLSPLRKSTQMRVNVEPTMWLLLLNVNYRTVKSPHSNKWTKRQILGWYWGFRDGRQNDHSFILFLKESHKHLAYYVQYMPHTFPENKYNCSWPLLISLSWSILYLIKTTQLPVKHKNKTFNTSIDACDAPVCYLYRLYWVCLVRQTRGWRWGSWSSTHSDWLHTTV